jgi:hypothetical protein
MYRVRRHIAKLCKEDELDEEQIMSRKELERARQKTPMQKSHLARKDTGASEVNANRVNIHIHSNRTSVIDESSDRTHDMEKSFRPFFDAPITRAQCYLED